MSNNKKDPKSCPFCGVAEFEDGRMHLRITSTSNGYSAIICSCGALGPMRESEQKAITAWNTRDNSEQNVIKYPFNLPETNDPPNLKGNLNSLGFPLILQILSSADKTGVLHIYQGQEVRRIYFRDGKIVAANGQRGTKVRSNRLCQRSYFASAVA